MNTMLTFDQYNDSELAQYALDHSQDPLVKALGARLLAAIDLAEEEAQYAKEALEEAESKGADTIKDLEAEVSELRSADREGRIEEALTLIPSNTKHKGLLAIRAALEE